MSDLDFVATRQEMWCALYDTLAGLRKIPDFAPSAAFTSICHNRGQHQLRVWRGIEDGIAGLSKATTVSPALRTRILNDWRKTMDLCWALARSREGQMRAFMRRASGVLDADDMSSGAMFALLDAAKSWDLERASWPHWATRMMGFYVARTHLQEGAGDALSPSDRVMRRSLRRAQRAFEAERANYSMRDLADATGIPLERVRSLLSPPWLVPLDSAEQFADDAAGEIALLESMQRRNASRILAEGLTKLDETQRAIVRAHFGFDSPAQSLPAIGRALGMSTDAVRRECRRGIHLLTAHLRAAGVEAL